MQDDRYLARLEAEKGVYKDCAKVHNLPQIFHYWSNKYIRPKMETLGFSTPNEMFLKYLEEQCKLGKQECQRFASIGAGNCDLEIALASNLRTKGLSGFAIDCIDLNAAMLERGRAAAVKEGVEEHISFVNADFNQWTPVHEYDAVIANQTLHHAVNLEGLFSQIKNCLKPHGSFIISDIIGRNGHQRWPEALNIVHEFWRKLPPSYRFNQQLGRYEELYENWDCSEESFEGIRAQDILPLLLDNFHFRLFFGFANVIDPFVDRAFGYHFDAKALWDRAFIDQAHQRDEEEMRAGHIKPTHMLAVVAKNGETPTLFHEPFRPEFCVRSPHASAGKDGGHSQTQPYEWHTWPHSPQNELQIACRRLSGAANRLREVEKRIKEATDWALKTSKEFDERTAWALRLDNQLAESNAWALRLDKELAEQAAWALQLNRELERLTWARWLYRYAAKLYHFALLLTGWLSRRLKRFLPAPGNIPKN